MEKILYNIVYFYITDYKIITMMTNNDILNEINLYRNWSKGTFKTVKHSVNLYTSFNKLTLEELIFEAESEEEQGILMKKRKIKKRFLNFQVYLINERQLSLSTVKLIISHIKSIYYFYELQVPRLPNITVQNNENINDIPNKKHIKEALLISNTKMRAIICFMASSGTARNEAANITIQDFIEATQDYHNSTMLNMVIEELEHQKTVIPTFALTRIKTHKTYYTFCSNEATQLIIQMLKERMKTKMITGEDKLFDIKKESLTINFSRLNDKIGFGFKETRRFFHPHSLRKFFTTQLFNAGMDFVSIEFLLGHSIGKTQEAYFKANPERQKHKYVQYVNKLCFFENTEYISITDKEKRELEVLRRESIETKERLKKLEEMLDLITFE